MPRSIVHKKGKLTRVIPPVKFHPVAPDAIVISKLVASRELTRKERNFIRKKFKTYVRNHSCGTVA